ncbi:radical SAM family heme chaperone HemW [Seonamhaeicola algicola]|uniref:Heme chaperone HemW n=1 Tax=Seonamhaeicola algicola TaxID=1719036 RepID=A0A5C7ALS7_9FLAO|nr:radical SAM family heme chaperone HemW [Seonamhaeicola algicola]TXE09696.1 radical SAM family heme chaperone HemW [Seonamhaeicola algicola]
MAGIYIHIPFCKQACYYCDFHFSTSLKKKDSLINALINEIKLRKHTLQNKRIETIYFGGGTPSLLNISELHLLIETVYNNFEVVETPEITLEANPDDLTTEKIIELSKTPINRLSIGVQSFFDDDLKMMNRAHNASESKKCLSVATQYFNNITIDLIYGIPNMSLQKWHKNLEIAFSFSVNHISSYALTVEPKTALHSFINSGKYPPLNEALALQHFNHLVETTAQQGFVHYEISNFGKPQFFSKHNTSYWQGKWYLGIGPSAHSFFGDQRAWNVSNNAKYIAAIEKKEPPVTHENLSNNDRFNEYIMTGLRTIWGVSFNRVETEFGSNTLNRLKKTAEKFIAEGLLNIVNEAKPSSTPKKGEFLQNTSSNSVLKTTNKGKFLADGIAAELFILS